MGPHKPTTEPPSKTGWYVVYRAAGSAYARPDIHFCAELEGHQDIGCMEACGDAPFRSVSAPYFAGALWHGPFSSRHEAQGAVDAA